MAGPGNARDELEMHENEEQKGGKKQADRKSRLARSNELQYMHDVRFDQMEQVQ